MSAGDLSQPVQHRSALCGDEEVALVDLLDRLLAGGVVLVGDITISGPSVPLRVSTVFGDVRMDLRGLRTGADRLDLYLTTFFGDVDVVVAEGVDAQIQGRTVLGARKVDLAPVPRVSGTPRIVVHARTVFGDLKLRSLAPGESASRWRQVMDRLAQASRSKGTAE